MLNKIIGILIILLLQNLLAEEYGLAEVLKMAEANNKTIQLARADLKTAAAEVKGAYSAALPKLDVNLGYNRNFKESKFFFTVTDTSGREITQSFRTSFTNQYQANAVLRQTLLSLQVGYGIQAARYFRRLSEENFEFIRQQVLAQTKIAFYQTLLLKEVLLVAQDSESSAKDNYENIKVKFESGIVSEFDLLQAEVRWQNSIPETFQAAQQYELALNNLKVLVGFPLEQPMPLRGAIDQFPALPETPGFEAVTAQRPDYNALVWQKKLQEKNVSAQKADRFPVLEGVLQYNYTAASDAFRFDNENDNYFLGLSLSIPLFSGGRTSAQIRKARADLDRANTRIAEADDNIRIQLANLQLRMKEARERISAANKAAFSARRAFEIAETRVDNGLSTQVELKDSRVALDRAQLNYYSAIFDYLRAYFEWELATGKVE